MNLLAELNPQQQQAVMAGLGPVLVLAGPGSGKTRVLTKRVAYLISAMGVRPYHILAVTFTNKAAREMERRVSDFIGENIQGLTLGTFHASCARILRREATHLPFNSNFVIYDADDQVSLTKRAIKDLNLNDKQFRPHSVHNAISNAKNELLLPDDYPQNTYRDEVVQRIYHRYQELLLNSNAVDFDDLLLWTAYLLQENPVVRDKYARRYEHVLVDEFQDTNLAQYRLLRHLASFHNNIFVVGDTDQSIYRWRGADYRNVLRFEEDYPDSQKILLEQNYRSTQTILDIAMAVIDRNPNRTRKSLFTERGMGQKASLHDAYNDHMEASYIIETISSLIYHQDAKPGDFAIMYRTNAQSRLIEEAFLQAGMQYKLVGAQRFYGRREIKDVIAYLRLVHNPNDELSLARVINTPTRGIGDKTFLELRVAQQKSETQSSAVSPGQMLLLLAAADGSDPAIESMSSRAVKVLKQFGSMLANWINLKEKLQPLVLMDRILEDIDYQTYIDDGSDEGHSRWENVLELRRLAADYQEEGLEPFLEQVALVSDQDTLDAGANVPTLLTLHAAKGLEFPTVFIIGLNEGTLPHSRSSDDPEEMMEERRLLYVGITRAKDRLYLLYSQNRSSYGYSEPAEPSRFLIDIPDDFLTGAHFGWRRSEVVPQTRTNYQTYGGARWENSSDLRAREESSAEQIPTQQYHPGMRVEHPKWGEGMVLNSRLEDDDEIVDIFFENLGLKKVAASLARLVKL